MEKLKQFSHSVHEYYGYLDKHATRVEELLAVAVKPCSSITNQCLILCAARQKEALEGTGLSGLPGFGELLCDCVFNSVSEQLELLVKIRDELTNSGNILLEKLRSVESSHKELKHRDLSALNPCSPRVEHILDWSLDAWRYFQALNLQISHTLDNLNFEDAHSVKSLCDAFREDRKLKQDLIRTRSFQLQQFEFFDQ